VERKGEKADSSPSEGEEDDPIAEKLKWKGAKERTRTLLWRGGECRRTVRVSLIHEGRTTAKRRFSRIRNRSREFARRFDKGRGGELESFRREVFRRTKYKEGGDDWGSTWR